MAELAYSLHLGSDKNRKNISKQNGRNNLSKSTSLTNNAIQNVRQLSKVDKHNYRKYDNEQELIEIIIELGDKEYWDTKDDEFKSRMSEVYRKQVNDLELLVPNFKVASAIIHYDESSPHMHIVGVPIKYNYLYLI